MYSLYRATVVVALWLVTFAMGYAQTNLLLNPSFEERRTDNPGKPNSWYFSSDLAPSLVRSAQHGTYSMRFYANVGSIAPMKIGPNGADHRYIEVSGGRTYRLSYWYRGDEGMTNLLPMFHWVGVEGATTTQTMQDQMIVTASQWQEKVIEVVAPAGATRLGFNLRVRATSGWINLDNFSLIELDRPIVVQPIDPPTGVVAEGHQREIELRWNRSLVEGVRWQVRLNGSAPIEVTAPHHTFAGLEPDTNYTVSVRAVGEGAESPYVTQSIKTARMTKGVDDPDRIPYLRTVGAMGVVSIELPLYYNDLARVDGQFVYRINGHVVTPRESKLLLPSVGKHLLEIDIIEAEGYEWSLVYKLNVR